MRGYGNPGFRVYADGREFGIDYGTRQEAKNVASAFQRHHPAVRYTVRAIPRCTSRNPMVGYMRCEKERHHTGICEVSGYKWYRGRGHARPVIIARPEWDLTPIY